MAISDLMVSLRRWQEGDEEACWKGYALLWSAHYHFGVNVLRPICGEARAEVCAEKAFEHAFEELDLMMGKVLATHTGETRTVRESDGTFSVRRIFRCKFSGRELAERKRFEWRGESESLALFRRIFLGKCWRELRASPAHEPFEPAEGDEEGVMGYAYADKKIADSLPNAEELSVRRDEVRELVDSLAQVAEQLHHGGYDAIAETTECLILYVKWSVARAAHHYAACSVDELQALTLEDILDNLRDQTDIQTLDFTDAWPFVRTTLGISRETAFKRKQLWFSRLSHLPAVPDSLRRVTGSIWQEEVQHWVEDCGKAAERLRNQGALDEAELLRLIESYLRWTFAQGHPTHRSRPPEWAPKAALKDLFKVYNPALLVPSYPDIDDFHEFVSGQKSDPRRIITVLRRLPDTIDKLDPRPIRLVTLVRDLQ